MRSRSWTRWASCALALTLSIPAFADAPRARKGVTECTSYEQADSGEDKVELTLHNSCTVPLSCSLSWRVVCAPNSAKRRSTHAGATKLALVEGQTASTLASASECGDDGWSIDNIQWSCKPDD